MLNSVTFSTDIRNKVFELSVLFGNPWFVLCSHYSPSIVVVLSIITWLAILYDIRNYDLAAYANSFEKEMTDNLPMIIILRLGMMLYVLGTGWRSLALWVCILVHDGRIFSKLNS